MTCWSSFSPFSAATLAGITKHAGLPPDAQIFDIPFEFIFCQSIYSINHLYGVTMAQTKVSDEEREGIIRRYDGFNSYNLFYGKPQRIIAIEAQHYRKTHNGVNPTYCPNLKQSNKVVNVLDGKLGMNCISDGAYQRIVWSDEPNKLVTAKITKYKIVNGKKRAARTEIIANDEEIDRIIKQEKIDDLNNCKTTLTYRSPYRHIRAEPPEINESIQILDMASCVKNPKVEPFHGNPPNVIIWKLPRVNDKEKNLLSPDQT